MTTEDMIAVMQGFVDGRVLEARPLLRDEGWAKSLFPQWDWMHYNYRLVPEPKTLWVNEYADGSGGYGYADKEAAMRSRSTIHGRQLVEYREVVPEANT